LKGDSNGLLVQPQLPKHWDGIKVVRQFRHATFNVSIQRADVGEIQVWQDGKRLTDARVDGIVAGGAYALEVLIPR
jgi:cellobionic acid phosphorylase